MTRGAHRIVGYGLDAEPYFVGAWTSDPSTLSTDLDKCFDNLDWIYVERQGGPGHPAVRVAFAGDDRDLPSAREFIAALAEAQA